MLYEHDENQPFIHRRVKRMRERHFDVSFKFGHGVLIRAKLLQQA